VKAARGVAALQSGGFATALLNHAELLASPANEMEPRSSARCSSGGIEDANPVILSFSEGSQNATVVAVEILR
jgi:hypothetical protein